MPKVFGEMSENAHINMKLFQRLHGAKRMDDYLTWIFENPKEAGEELCRMEEHKIPKEETPEVEETPSES